MKKRNTIPIIPITLIFHYSHYLKLSEKILFAPTGSFHIKTWIRALLRGSLVPYSSSCHIVGLAAVCPCLFYSVKSRSGPRTQNSGQRERITSLSLPSTFCLAQPRRQLAFFATRAHCCGFFLPLACTGAWGYSSTDARLVIFHR